MKASTCERCGRIGYGDDRPKGWDTVHLAVNDNATVLCAECVADYYEWLNSKAEMRSDRP